MIVLDEELQGLGLEEAISGWYRGSVLLIKALRPGTVIKDEAIPGLLRRVRRPAFVTINHGDFWRRTAPPGLIIVLPAIQSRTARYNTAGPASCRQARCPTRA